MNIPFDLGKKRLLKKYLKNLSDFDSFNECVNFSDKFLIQKHDTDILNKRPQFIMRPLNPLNNQEELDKRTINQIKSKAETAKLYPNSLRRKIIKHTEEAEYIVDESNKFLESVNFSNFNDDPLQRKSAYEDGKKVSFEDVKPTMSTQGLGIAHNIRQKNDPDGFFANPTPSKHKDVNEDDLFADDSPKQGQKSPEESGSEDDLFGGGTTKKQSKKEEPKEEDDDMFGTDQKEELKENGFDKKDLASEMQDKHSEDEVVVGDIFIKCLNEIAMRKSKEITKERHQKKYFGELKDAHSTYVEKLKEIQKNKELKEMLKKKPFEVLEGKVEGVKLMEKTRLGDIKNKNFIESKLFSKLSLYNYKNKDIENKFKLNLLSSNDKVKTKLMILETDKKRKDK